MLWREAQYHEQLPLSTANKYIPLCFERLDSWASVFGVSEGWGYVGCTIVFSIFFIKSSIIENTATNHHGLDQTPES